MKLASFAKEKSSLECKMRLKTSNNNSIWDCEASSFNWVFYQNKNCIFASFNSILNEKNKIKFLSSIKNWT